MRVEVCYHVLYYCDSQDGFAPSTESKDYFISFLIWTNTHTDQPGLNLAL